MTNDDADATARAADDPDAPTAGGRWRSSSLADVLARLGGHELDVESIRHRHALDGLGGRVRLVGRAILPVRDDLVAAVSGGCPGPLREARDGGREGERQGEAQSSGRRSRARHVHRAGSRVWGCLAG